MSRPAAPAGVPARVTHPARRSGAAVATLPTSCASPYPGRRWRGRSRRRTSRAPRVTGVTGPWSFHDARGSVGGLHDGAGLGAMLRGGQEPLRPSPALARSRSWYRPDMSDSADHPGVSGCYAAELGDCSGRLSGEHWISAAVLRLLAEPAGVSIRGAPWLGGAVRAVPVRKLKANILCKGHNERLSWLDQLAPVWARKLGVGVDADSGDCWRRSGSVA